MLIAKPKTGTVVWVYYPDWLTISPIGKAYYEHTYYDLDYSNHKLASGLLYKTEEEVIARIKSERQRLQELQNLQRLKEE